MATLLNRARTAILIILNNRTKVLMVLDWGSIFAAFLAAVWWFRSAAVHLPAPLSYWTETPENDPFFMAIKESANLSGSAARFAALSVVLTAIASWVRSRNIMAPTQVEPAGSR